jgi:hypothetical protein
VPPSALPSFEDQPVLVGAAHLQVRRGADARQPGADDDHVVMLDAAPALGALQEGCGLPQRAPGLGQQPPGQLPDMEHHRPDAQLHQHAGGARLLRQAQRIVAQHLVLADMNHQRRQAVQVTEQRRSQRLRRVGAGQVGRQQVAQMGAGEHGVAIAIGEQRGAAAGEVQRRREQHGGIGQRLAGVAQHLHQAECQVAAGAVAAHHQAAADLGAQRTPDGLRVLRRGGEGMFGRQPVVGHEDAQTLQRQRRRQRPVRARRAADEAAAVQVEQRRRRPVVGRRGRAGQRLDPLAGDSAHHRRRVAHAAGRRQPLREDLAHPCDVGHVAQRRLEAAAHDPRRQVRLPARPHRCAFHASRPRRRAMSRAASFQ